MPSSLILIKKNHSGSTVHKAAAPSHFIVILISNHTESWLKTEEGDRYLLIISTM